VTTKVRVGDPTTRAWKLLIGGDLVDGAAGTYDVVNPATEEVVGRCPEASVGQAEDAARAAQEAFPAWSQTPASERARLLTAVTGKLVELQDELVPLIISETGATAAVGSRMQVPVAIERFTRYSRDATKDIGIALPPSPVPSTPLAPGALMGAHVNRQPVGAVACISPYNFPLTNVAGKIAPALAVGCTVVVKPAPQDPLAILVLAELMHEVGFPPGVVNVITGAEAAPAAALTSSRHIDMVSFTGSTAVGQRIYEAGAAGMKRMLLELGGKGACVVLDDADLSTALTAIASVWTFHSGQICTAPTRAIVHRSRYDEMVDKLAAYAGRLKVGDPLDRDTVVGPVISGVQRDRIEAHVDEGAAEGATLVVDGRRPAHLERGYYVAPTLLADCKPGMQPVQEEIFGPVVVVLPFDDDDEAIAIANSTDFGLYDYVMTGDTERGYRMAGRLRSGNVGVNTAQRNMEAPFGGFKLSGIGRDGGDFGLHAYTEMQSVMWPG
jgi:phenylacetaldehyde dehydrogenase